MVIAFIGSEYPEFTRVLSASVRFNGAMSDREIPLVFIGCNRTLMCVYFEIEKSYFDLMDKERLTDQTTLRYPDGDNMTAFEWKKEPYQVHYVSDGVIFRDPLLEDKEDVSVFKIRESVGEYGAVIYQWPALIGLCRNSSVVPIDSILAYIPDSREKIAHSPQVSIDFSLIPREMKNFNGLSSGVYVGNVYSCSIFFGILETGDVLLETKIGDVVMEINTGVDIALLLREIQWASEETTIGVKYDRDGTVQEIEAKIELKDCIWPLKVPEDIVIVGGLVIGRMTLDMARKYGIPTPNEDPFSSLLIVYHCVCGTSSRKGQISVGDVISKCNSKRVTTSTDLLSALKEDNTGNDGNSYIILVSAKNKICMMEKKRCIKESERINSACSTPAAWRLPK